MRGTMKKLIQGATRLLVLALGLGLASTGWATDYTYSNVDSDSLADVETMYGHYPVVELGTLHQTGTLVVTLASPGANS